MNYFMTLTELSEYEYLNNLVSELYVINSNIEQVKKLIIIIFYLRYILIIVNIIKVNTMRCLITL